MPVTFFVLVMIRWRKWENEGIIVFKDGYPKLWNLMNWSEWDWLYRVVQKPMTGSLLVLKHRHILRCPDY